MIAAPVGFQCPECVKDGSKTVRQARTQFGGKVQTSSDLVTRILIGTNAVVYLIQLVGGDRFTNRFSLIPRAFVPGLGSVGVADGEWYRLVTAMFLHASLLHIAFNMWALWVLGPPLESLLGRSRFLTLYLLSGIGGSAASYMFSPVRISSVGASGAIFGLFAATIVIGRRLNLNIQAIAVVLGLNLALGFTFNGIDWRAHVGGMITGFVVGGIFAYAPRERRTQLHVAGCVLVALAIVLVVILRTSQLT